MTPEDRDAIWVGAREFIMFVLDGVKKMRPASNVTASIAQNADDNGDVTFLVHGIDKHPMPSLSAVFDFGEALQRIRAGKRVKRVSWLDTYAISLSADGRDIVSPFGPLNHAAMLATDWVELQ